jgi:hypothetical protein
MKIKRSNVMDFEKMFTLTTEEQQRIEKWVSEYVAPANCESVGGMIVAFEFSPLGTDVYCGVKSYAGSAKLIVRD